MQRALKASVTRWITKAYEYEVGFLHAGGGIPCRPHPAATQLVFLRYDYVISEFIEEIRKSYQP